MSTKKISIYGGSFNPVHLGHVALADAICRCGVVDEVWFMVSPLNPLKKDAANQLLPTDIRLHLTSLALTGYDHLKVSDFETRLPIPSYTVNTLEALKNAFPQHDFSIIVGQDNWQNFHRWVEADKIKANHDIIVYGRHTADESTADDHRAEVCLYKKNGTETRLSDTFPFQLYDISSTQIREAFRMRNLPFAAKWLTPSVCRYILEYALYS